MRNSLEYVIGSTTGFDTPTLRSDVQARGSVGQLIMPAEDGGELGVHRALLALVNDAVLAWDEHGTIVESNAAAHRYLGFDNLLGRNIVDVRAGMVQAGAVRFRHRQGDELLFNATETSIGVGTARLGVCVFRPRQLDPGDLEELSDSYRVVVDAVQDVIFQIAASGHWIFVNHAWAELTGYTIEQTLAQSFFEFLATEDVARAHEQIDALVEKRSAEARFQARVVTSDHQKRWVQVALRPCILGDAVVGFAGTLSDVSERYAEAQELRRAKEHAESTASAKEEFLANMSHEIRTPMNAVIALTGLLLDTPLSDEQRDFAETIRASGENLLAIINEILDFSKIESGHLVLEQTEFDVIEAIESAVELVAAQPKARDLELIIDIHPDVPTLLIGDPTRLRQVIVNLVSNAVKFTPQGHIKVSAMPTVTGDQRLLHVEVQDTGIGIAPEHAAGLFRPFSQADASTTRKYGGTGLGLMICKRLIEFMGGEIDFRSQVGVGTTFYFSVPMRHATIATAKPSKKLLGRNVCLLHGYATSAAQLAAVLRQAGASVHASLAGRADACIVDEAWPEFEAVVQQGFAPLIVLVNQATRGSWQAILAKAQQRGRVVVPVAKPVRRTQLLAATGSVFGDTLLSRTPMFSAERRVKPSIPPMRVLVAEDNVVNQKVATSMLARHGLRPDLASNGLEALHAMRDHAYDVVFLDVQMPEMDGLEAARQIVRTMPAARRPFLVAMTANVSTKDRMECLEAGVDHYIPKPVTADALQEGLRLAVLHRPVRVSDGVPEVAAVPSTEKVIVAGVAERLSELERDVGADVTREIAGYFIEDGPQKMAALRHCVQRKAEAESSRAAHALRSSALNLGAFALAQTCGQIEREPTLANLPSLVERAEEELAASLEYLREYINRAKA